MSEEELKNADPLEVDTESPDPQVQAEPNGWKMPEPVFRKTSGYLPQGFEKRFPAAFSPTVDEETASAHAAPTGAGAAAAAAPAPEVSAANVEPQPELPETSLPDNVNESVVSGEKPRSSGLRVVMLVLGAVAILAFVGAFLAFVYFWFVASPGDTGNFGVVRP